MSISKYLSVLLILILIGCSPEDTSEIHLSLQGNNTILRKAIKVEMTAGGLNTTLYGKDFSSPDSQLCTKTFITPTSGSIFIKFTLSDAIRGELNSGVITLNAKPDWHWSVDFQLSSENPFNGCFGCVDYKAFPIDSVFQTSNQDSLFIIWGGNSIKNPVIY